MKNIPLLLATLVGTLILVVGIAVVFSQSTENTQNADPAVVLGDGKRSQGPEQAKVTVVEFSDFQCPACRSAQPLIKSVIAKYPNDVRFVYRHFPLTNLHPYAQIAAQAAESAGEQGKFWEFHDKLFETQTEWSELKNQDEVLQRFEALAAELQIDKQQFLERIQDESLKQRIAQDIADGTKVGVAGTPTLYVNGKKVAAPDLESEINSILEQQ